MEQEKEKLWKVLFRESWLTISLLVITSVFASGSIYTHVNADIEQNKRDLAVLHESINDIRTNVIQQQHEDKLELNQRLDELDAKIDEINRYLRAKVK